MSTQWSYLLRRVNTGDSCFIGGAVRLSCTRESKTSFDGAH